MVVAALQPRPVLADGRPCAQAIQRGPVDEAYWLNWTSECRGDGGATIRVARVGSESMFFRSYRPGHFGKTQRSRGMVLRSDWTLIVDAVVAANFWMLDDQKPDV